MKKVILNAYPGGNYGWSIFAIHELLLRKRINFKFMAMVLPKSGGIEHTELTKEDFFQLANEITYGNKLGNPYYNDAMVGFLFFVDDNGKRWASPDIDRDDPDAVELLEMRGSDFCSGKNAYLYIEEYDDTQFDYCIREEDIGEEYLEPLLTEERVRACSSVSEVVDLLQKMHVLTSKEKLTALRLL